MHPSSRSAANRTWAWVTLLAIGLAANAQADTPYFRSHPSDRTSPPPDTTTSSTTGLPPELLERNLSGPRFGVTYRPNEGSFGSRDVGRFVSQFGWHFETQVVPFGGGPQFIIQFVPLVAGVEYGKALPSASLGMGVRFPSGYEFGIGPTVAVGRRGEYEAVGLRSALFMAVGRSFDYSGVSIPVNAVVAANKDGARVSLLVGYAIRRASRPITRQP